MVKFICSFNATVFIVLILCSGSATAQTIKVGPSFGGYFSNRVGVNIIDSIKVVTDQVSQEAVIGIFAESKIWRRLKLRTELNFFENFVDYAIYNEVQECQFCPIVKAKGISARTLEWVVLPKLQLPISRMVSVSVFGGPSIHFRFRNNEESFGDLGRRHPGLTEVYHALDKSVTPVHVYMAYGASLDVWRMNLSARYVNTAKRSSLEEIEVYGEKYPISFKDKFLVLTLSYGFNLPAKIGE